MALRPTHFPGTHAHACLIYTPRILGLTTRVGTPTPAHCPALVWSAFHTKALEWQLQGPRRHLQGSLLRPVPACGWLWQTWAQP